MLANRARRCTTARPPSLVIEQGARAFAPHESDAVYLELPPFCRRWTPPGATGRLPERVADSALSCKIVVLGFSRRQIFAAKRCEVCGRGPTVGRTVSHAHNVGPRRFEPNLQTVRAIVNAARRGAFCALPAKQQVRRLPDVRRRLHLTLHGRSDIAGQRRGCVEHRRCPSSSPRRGTCRRARGGRATVDVATDHGAVIATVAVDSHGQRQAGAVAWSGEE